MFTKSIFAFAAALVVSSASAAVAYENPENKIGDRFQFLEQDYQPIQGSRNVGRFVMPRQLASSIKYTNEVHENQIGDRCPLLQPA